MKINQIIIFALLIVYIYSQTCLVKSNNPSTPGDCGEPDDEAKKQKYTKCCLVKYDDIANVGRHYGSGSTIIDGKPECRYFREKTLKNLKTYIKYEEVENGYENMEIDCNSNYIKLSLIGLLLFFI